LAGSAEAGRLLSGGGSDALAAQPLAVEIRGTELEDVDTAAVARRFAQHLVDKHGGLLWEAEPELPRDDRNLLGATEHPAVSAVTEKNAVLVQDRPVVSLSSWLVDDMAVFGRK